MLLIDKDHYSSEVPFISIVLNTQKAAMVRIAEILSIPVRRSSRKNVLLHEMSNYIQYQAIHWALLLPEYELDLLKRILDLPRGEGVRIFSRTFGHGLVIGELCVVMGYPCLDDSLRWTLYLSTESIREDLKVAVKAALEMRSAKPYLQRWERMGTGLLNYFGVLPLRDFLEEMKIRTGVKPSSREEGELLRLIGTNSAFTSSICLIGDETGLVKHIASPWMEELDFILEEQEIQNAPQANLGKPSNECLMAFGACPHMLPFLGYDMEFHRFLLENLRLEKEKADWLFSNVRYMAMSGHVYPVIRRWIIQKISQISDNQLNAMMEIFRKMAFFTPRWYLCGMTLEEDHLRMEEKRNPVPAVLQSPENPGKPPSGAVPASVGAIPRKKVGRNDPCPCGSGKKYKHCCGR